MATIALYSNKINQMPGMIKDVRQSVIDYKSELSELKMKTLTINSSVCDLEDVISSIQSSTQTQEDKVESLDTFIQGCEEFITDVQRIDEDVADIIRQRKEDFYDQYYYLKPECEKNDWEKFCDGCNKVGEWCKEHWKLVVTVVIVIAAIVLICTGVGGILGAMALGALLGAVIGGVAGGVMNAITGGSFWEGFENGAFSGAISGIIFGGFGGAGQMVGGSCRILSALGGADKVLKVMSCAAKISGGLSAIMDGFDLLAFGIAIFDSTNPLVKFNEKLHSSTLYNALQFSANAVAAFSGGALIRMKQGAPVCFVAGTMILTAAGLVAIENIKAGDKVVATNEDTFETAEKKVLETYIRETNQLVHLTINKELITTTINHPFYIKNLGFVNAGELQAGNEVVNQKGEIYTVENVRFEFVESTEKVYNFQVEDFHTYHVGNSGVLVHNSNCGLKTVDTGDLKVIETKTPEVANSEWLARGYDKPPYSPDYEVKVVQAGNDEYVRVFSYNDEGTSNKLGGWLMKKSDIEGLTPAQIADKYALPKEPTHICDVNVNSDFNLQTGIANSVEGWGNGGGQQFDTMGKFIDEDAFVNERLIGE